LSAVAAIPKGELAQKFLVLSIVMKIGNMNQRAVKPLKRPFGRTSIQFDKEILNLAIRERIPVFDLALNYVLICLAPL